MSEKIVKAVPYVLAAAVGIAADRTQQWFRGRKAKKEE